MQILIDIFWTDFGNMLFKKGSRAQTLFLMPPSPYRAGNRLHFYNVYVGFGHLVILLP